MVELNVFFFSTLYHWTIAFDYFNVYSFVTFFIYFFLLWLCFSCILLIYLGCAFALFNEF